MITVGNKKVRIKKSSVTISENNAELLRFLDGIAQIEKYTELSMEETKEIMLSYLKQKRFTKEQLLEITSGLTGATAKKLIVWG